MAGVRSKPQRNGKYQGWYQDHTGRRVFFVGTHKESQTRHMAERLEDEHRQIKLGYRPVPKSAAKHAKRPFKEVAEEYLAWGNAQGGRGGRPWGKCHAHQREKQLTWWRERLGLEALADVEGTLSRVEGALRELREAGRPDVHKRHQRGGLSGKTLNSYADTLRAFCSWCVERGYLDANPLDGLAPFDATPETRRRAMTADEIALLLEAAPEHRRLLYETAFCTGLRAGELRALTVDALDMERSGLLLDAEWTKNRKPGIQPIPHALARRLAAFAGAGTASELYASKYARRDAKLKGFPDNPLLYVPSHAARELREDLRAAGVAAFIAGEGKVDFHSCRVAYVTFILEAGATVKEGQVLARHATPGLTLNTYARTRNERLAELAEKVGETVFPSRKRALCVHRLAAGAEMQVGTYCGATGSDSEGLVEDRGYVGCLAGLF